MSPFESSSASESARWMLSSRFHYLADDLIRPIVRLCPNSVGCLAAPARIRTGEFSGFADGAHQAHRAISGSLALGDQHRHSQISCFADLALMGSCFRWRVHARPLITQERNNIKGNLRVETKKAAGQGGASGEKGNQATSSDRLGHPRSV